MAGAIALRSSAGQLMKSGKAVSLNLEVSNVEDNKPSKEGWTDVNKRDQKRGEKRKEGGSAEKKRAVCILREKASIRNKSRKCRES
jgi:hypothetical protein